MLLVFTFNTLVFVSVIFTWVRVAEKVRTFGSDKKPVPHVR